MPFRIVRNDITKMQVDAVVNTANAAPVYSTGTDAAIYEAAGAEELLAARKKIGYLEEGSAAVTPGFCLPAKYIIHAVSAAYRDGTCGEAEVLRSCYEKSLQLALEYGCQSIAFPLIATGNFGYPREEAMQIALSAIQAFLMKEEMMVYLVIFDKETVRLSGQIFDEIEAFVDENYVAEKQWAEYKTDRRRAPVFNRIQPDFCAPMPETAAFVPGARPKPPVLPHRTLEDIVANAGQTFQQQLFRLIDERGRDEVEVYKRAGKDKKFFHKIRSNVYYQPGKHTVFAFALALELSLDETKDLLASAGYAFSPSSRFDLIMQYVFERKIYDIYKVDCILYDMGEERYFGCE